MNALHFTVVWAMDKLGYVTPINNTFITLKKSATFSVQLNDAFIDRRPLDLPVCEHI